MKLFVETVYSLGVMTAIDLPVGTTQSDIKEVFVKYGRIQIFLNDGSVIESAENDADVSNIEWKYPDSTRLFPEDSSGEWADFDKEIK